MPLHRNFSFPDEEFCLAKVTKFAEEFFDDGVLESLTTNTNLYNEQVKVTKGEMLSFIVTSFMMHSDLNAVTPPMTPERWEEIMPFVKFNNDFENDGFAEMRAIFNMISRFYH